jgi:hypothetical protein
MLLLFQNIHSISREKVDIIISKRKSTNCGVIPQDARGKHDCAFKLVDERAEIKQHIESFPYYFSHYSRGQTKKMYLPSNLNMKKTYYLYAKNVCESNRKPASYKIYFEVFRQTG